MQHADSPITSLIDESLCITLNNDNGIWATVGMGVFQAWDHHYAKEKTLNDIIGDNMKHDRWTHHVLSYDLKQYIENIEERKNVRREMPLIISVQPQLVFKFRVDREENGFLILQGNFNGLSSHCYDLMEEIRRAYSGEKTKKSTSHATCLHPIETQAEYTEIWPKLRLTYNEEIFMKSTIVKRLKEKLN